MNDGTRMDEEKGEVVTRVALFENHHKQEETMS